MVSGSSSNDEGNIKAYQQMTKYLHIVCLDVPWPADYGGAIDMFYKIRYLSQSGVKIILHCFEYGRPQSRELEAYCEQVFYYPRKKILPFRFPYIVVSRKNRELRNRLTCDDYPVLLEGIHCTYYLYNGALKNKKVWVRLHNVESEYYRNLAFYTHHVFKKIYFLFESFLLKRYEKRLAPNHCFLTLSHSDEKFLTDAGAGKSVYLPLFAGDMHVVSEPGKGSFCLYHGNLSISENERAVEFLVQEVFSNLDLPLVIAGKNPSGKIRKLCARSRVKLIPNPDDKKLIRLLKEAHIHVLPSMNTTGIKVKLLYALTRGRFVITNKHATGGTILSELCSVADGAAACQSAIEHLWDCEFTSAEIAKREELLRAEFDPHVNARKMEELFFID